MAVHSEETLARECSTFLAKRRDKCCTPVNGTGSQGDRCDQIHIGSGPEDCRRIVRSGEDNRGL